MVLEADEQNNPTILSQRSEQEQKFLNSKQKFLCILSSLPFSCHSPQPSPRLVPPKMSSSSVLTTAALSQLPLSHQLNLRRCRHFAESTLLPFWFSSALSKDPTNVGERPLGRRGQSVPWHMPCAYCLYACLSCLLPSPGQITACSAGCFEEERFTTALARLSVPATGVEAKV